MLSLGIAILAVGFFWAAFKGYVVWETAHDLFNGVGVPTADFFIFCPIPIAIGTSYILKAIHLYPFPGFGFILYVVIAAVFFILHTMFDRLGAPERKRQLVDIERRAESIE